MTVTTTELAKHSKRVIDQVINHGEVVEVRQCGRSVAEIRPKVGTTRQELLRILGRIRWTDAESRELKQAMDAASAVVGYAGRD